MSTTLCSSGRVGVAGADGQDERSGADRVGDDGDADTKDLGDEFGGQHGVGWAGRGDVSLATPA